MRFRSEVKDIFYLWDLIFKVELIEKKVGKWNVMDVKI